MTGEVSMTERIAEHLALGVKQPPDSRAARCRNCQEPLAIPEDWTASTWFRCMFCRQGQTVAEVMPSERSDVVKMDSQEFYGSE
jgi:hypothetical protein